MRCLGKSLALLVATATVSISAYADDTIATYKKKPYWADSFSVGNACYCASNYDHGLKKKTITIDGKAISIPDVCDAAAKALTDKPTYVIYYNDIQCGNGPANDAKDETVCPGVPTKYRGANLSGETCNYRGPKWDLSKIGVTEDDTAPATDPETGNPVTDAVNDTPSTLEELQKQFNALKEQYAVLRAECKDLRRSISDKTERRALKQKCRQDLSELKTEYKSLRSTYKKLRKNR